MFSAVLSHLQGFLFGRGGASPQESRADSTTRVQQTALSLLQSPSSSNDIGRPLPLAQGPNPSPEPLSQTSACSMLRERMRSDAPRPHLIDDAIAQLYAETMLTPAQRESIVMRTYLVLQNSTIGTIGGGAGRADILTCMTRLEQDGRFSVEERERFVTALTSFIQASNYQFGWGPKYGPLDWCELVLSPSCSAQECIQLVEALQSVMKRIFGVPKHSDLLFEQVRECFSLPSPLTATETTTLLSYTQRLADLGLVDTHRLFFPLVRLYCSLIHQQEPSTSEAVFAFFERVGGALYSCRTTHNIEDTVISMCVIPILTCLETLCELEGTLQEKERLMNYFRDMATLPLSKFERGAPSLDAVKEGRGLVEQTCEDLIAYGSRSLRERLPDVHEYLVHEHLKVLLLTGTSQAEGAPSPL